jgi:hypothetical protein
MTNREKQTERVRRMHEGLRELLFSIVAGEKTLRGSGKMEYGSFVILSHLEGCDKIDCKDCIKSSCGGMSQDVQDKTGVKIQGRVNSGLRIQEEDIDKAETLEALREYRAELGRRLDEEDKRLGVKPESEEPEETEFKKEKCPFYVYNLAWKPKDWGESKYEKTGTCLHGRWPDKSYPVCHLDYGLKNCPCGKGK